MAGTNTKLEKDKSIERIKAALYLLQEHLEDFKSEVDKSYALLKIGEVTGIAEEIKQKLDNPIAALLKTSSNIDGQITHIIEVFVKAFFRAHKELLSEVHRSKTSMNQLHYSIFLKNDTTENRSKIFDFLDIYDLMDFSTKYPVYFQFMPIELRDKIKSSEIIEIT